MEDDSVVISSLVRDTPEFSDTILEFLDTLPNYMHRIQAALSHTDWAEMGVCAHNIKGVGGSYGFPQLSEVAQELEFQIAKRDSEEVRASINKLNALIRRVISGRAEYLRILGPRSAS